MADEKPKESAGSVTLTTTAAEYDSTTILPLWKCIPLLMLAALWSPVSQLMLSPSHGAIPAAAHHTKITINALIMTVPLDVVFLNVLPIKEKPFYLPILAFSIPMVQQRLVFLATIFGPAGGAFFAELLTYGMIVALTLNVTWQSFTRFVPSSLDLSARTFVPPAIAGALVYGFERAASSYLPGLIGTHPLLTRSYLPVLLATATAALLPSTYLMFAAPPLFQTLFLNMHTPLPIPRDILNTELATVNFTLLDRKESLTGYISVLQNEYEGFRVMRCDHSLLGGEWVFGVGKWAGGKDVTTEHKAVVGEPVYSVFVMLEAIRLVQDAQQTKRAKQLADRDASALVIGLGIGTTPAAFVAHGIKTTVVEIDPVVLEFARDYFALPTNLTGIIEDATEFVTHDKGKYNYIVHDVFTGGAEPVELFTVEFIQSLSDLLTENGVIAINYAADLLLPPTALTVRTILSVFPTCRIFREDELKNKKAIDFTNLVFFCRKSARPFSFREPIEADYLGTRARQQALVPRFEVDPVQFDLTGESDGLGNVLKRANMGVLVAWQSQGATNHWRVMRTVMPPLVWENW